MAAWNLNYNWYNVANRLALNNGEPQFLIDTAALNRKYANSARQQDARRWFTGVTQVDVDCTGAHLKEKLVDAAKRFIEAFYKKRWDLVGQVYVGQPHKAR